MKNVVVKATAFFIEENQVAMRKSHEKV